jgi:plastocyanin
MAKPELRAIARAASLGFAVAFAISRADAATYVVTANADMTFTPGDLTIYQGDTIRFENGGGVHNVHADNNRFRCAVNCTTNNSPSDSAWHVTVQFNLLGTLGYYCDQHGDLVNGMRGSITVIDRVFVDGFDPAAVRTIGAVTAVPINIIVD